MCYNWIFTFAHYICGRARASGRWDRFALRELSYQFNHSTIPIWHANRNCVRIGIGNKVHTSCTNHLAASPDWMNNITHTHKKTWSSLWALGRCAFARSLPSKWLLITALARRWTRNMRVIIWNCQLSLAWLLRAIETWSCWFIQTWHWYSFPINWTMRSGIVLRKCMM